MYYKVKHPLCQPTLPRLLRWCQSRRHHRIHRRVEHRTARCPDWLLCPSLLRPRWGSLARCSQSYSRLGKVAVGQAHQVAQELVVPIAALCLVDPTQGHSTIMSTAGYDALHSHLKGMCCLVLGDLAFLLVLDNQVLQIVELGFKCSLVPSGGIDTAWADTVSILVHVPEDAL